LCETPCVWSAGMSMITTSEIMRLAELRDGLVTRHQLRKHGLSDPQISRLVMANVLCPVFRGVYAMTPPPWPLTTRALGACLAAPGAVVSDMSAAAHWRLRRTPRDVLEVVVKSPRFIRLPGVRVHRTNMLGEVDIVRYANGLRVTSPARTLFDIAAELDPNVLASATQDALNRRLCTPWSLWDVGERLIEQGRPGGVVFREVIQGPAAKLPAVGSDPELVLASALELAGLPQLVRQFDITLDGYGDVRLDLAVPLDRFNIEVDDPYWHADPVALQSDHARDLLLDREGWHVLRVTTEDVDQRIHSTTATLARIYFRDFPRRLSA
jgi:very-short-patch-repair endonuclease